MQTLLSQGKSLPGQEAEQTHARGDSIAARIAAYADAIPTATAVSDEAVRFTWRELDRQSDQLATRLVNAGAGAEQCIGLFLDRSVDFVVAALAVLKSGAAYLPLDPSTPAERGAFILSDAGATILLTHRSKSCDWAPDSCRVIDLTSLELSAGSDGNQVDLVDADRASLAYVVYTSGSTGRPKGVEITHANLLNLIEWHQAAFQVTSADRASQVAGLGFDAAGWEIWPHLTAGASVHIVNEMTRRSSQSLRDWLVAQEITIAFVPTVLAEQLLHATWPVETKLKTLLTGADTLHRRPPKGLPFKLVNNYGPTECTVVSTSGLVEPDAAIDGPPTIGRPIHHAKAYILDDSLQPVPVGEAGELCLAGALVGRGYRNNPQGTATRFVDFVPQSGPTERIYRTGDRAKFLHNGEIVFLGRLDDQVKIRGYRIELGEIVACLDRYPGIEASAVVTRDDLSSEEQALVAYIVLTQDAKVTSADLREFIAARLPDYMIPPLYVRVPHFPITANGKLDKSALPAPGPENLLAGAEPVASGTVATSGAETDLEQRIGAMVSTLLGQPSVARQDNFFMLGGHSMLGAQLVARIRDTFGVKLSLRQLFGAPTVMALSAEVARLIAVKT